MTAAPDSAKRPGPAYGAAFEALPDVVLLLGPTLEISAANLAAQRELGPLPTLLGASCCTVLRCEPRCPARLAAERRQVVRGRSTDFPPREITAAPLGDGGGVVVQVPSASVGAERREPLHIAFLGHVSVARAGEELGGEWLDQRPGLLFKYLVCARGRSVGTEELLDALWPRAGHSAIGNVRQTVHVLRGRLEREDGPRVIVGRRGGYALDASACAVDADEFDRRATAALRAAAGAARRDVAPALRDAADLYAGDFLADTPYADWALAERDRHRSLASRVLWELATLETDAGELQAATQTLYRLAALEPLDLQAQRALLTMLIGRGRHADAARRYDAVRTRFRRAFGREPDFALADLA